MKKLLIASLLLCSVWASAQNIVLNAESRSPEYVRSIVARSQKIVNKLNLTDTTTTEQVCNLIANRYFELNDIYAARDARQQAVRDAGLSGEAAKEALQAAETEKDAALYRTHFAFPAALSLFLTEEQIDIVKDGMTYGVLRVTYDSHLDMIPTLTTEEKTQILAWLTEAREFAMDAENSEKKHAVFGKYKGRINNYLAARGYDLKKEREEWYKRVKSRGGKL